MEMSHLRPPSAWFLCPRRLVQPRYRMVCLPHAGAGASLFFGWATKLQPHGIELRSIQYPGRESRLSEPLIDCSEAMAESIAEEWPAISSGHPTLLFGHSMGGLLAHEVALALARRRVPNPPRRLIISGRNPPHVPSREEKIFSLPDQEFLRAVAQRHGKLPQQLFSDSELSALISRVLRADFTLLDTYEWKPSPPLEVSLTILGGAGDPFVRPDILPQWSAYSRRSCCVHLIQGDHFFHQSAPNAVIAAILADL